MNSTIRNLDDVVAQPVTEQALKEWLLRGATSNEWAPASFFAEPSIPTQLQRLYAASAASTQELFKRAVVRAVAEWSIEAHALEAIATLARVSAYVRATGVIAQLAHVVRSRLLARARSRTGPEAEEVESTAGEILAVIAGFAPYSEATIVVEGFYYDNTVPERYTAVLFNALCRSNPDRYHEYIPRMARLLDRRRESFHASLIIDRAVETITPPIFAKHLQLLDRDTLRILIGFMDSDRKIRARIVAGEHSFSLVTSYGGVTSLLPCGGEGDVADAMEAMMQSYTMGGGLEALANALTN